MTPDVVCRHHRLLTFPLVIKSRLEISKILKVSIQSMQLKLNLTPKIVKNRIGKKAQHPNLNTKKSH